MKTYEPADIRNCVIVGHASSGKTILSEAMLACSGEINRMGSIVKGNTVSDYHSSEKQRQNSVHATQLHCEWLEKKFNIIDSPGYIDFISEGLGALRVGDSAVVVIHADQGVEVGTEKVWEYATQFGIPKVLVVNALDREEVDFDRVLADARERFGNRVFPLTLPINPGTGFNQVLDIPRNEIITFKTDGTGQFEEAPASGEWKEKVEQMHQQLIEYVAESDEKLLEKFFEESGLTEEELRKGIHTAIQNESFIPLFCVSAQNNVGVARLMDFIAKYGSSPLDRKSVKALNGNEEETTVDLNGKDPVLYIYKTLNEPQVGEVSCFRLYSGSIHSGMDLYNSRCKSNERIGQVFILNGKNRTSVDTMNAGDIGAFVKLRNTHTGDTLCHQKSVVSLPAVKYPEPNIHAAIKNKSKGEEAKVAEGLSVLHVEDPTFLFQVDGELHQTVVSAQGELHLEVLRDRLKRRFNVEVDLEQPKIRYRETIKSRGESKYRHKKQSGGAGQFAEVWMRIEAKPRDTDIEFTQSLVGQNVDRVFVPSVEKGVRKACAEGILAGYSVVDVKIDFYDGKMHPVDSKDVAFQIAGYFAFKEAFMAAKPALLEPIHELEIKIPEEAMGKVMGDLTSRRGKILGMDSDGRWQILKAEVPASELYHYATSLRSLTGGRGIHTERFNHYEELPKEYEKKVIEASKHRDEEEK